MTVIDEHETAESAELREFRLRVRSFLAEHTPAARVGGTTRGWRSRRGPRTSPRRSGSRRHLPTPVSIPVNELKVGTQSSTA